MHSAAVVDDSATSRAILAKMLNDYGLVVHEAEDSLSALKILRDHPGVRVILVDWDIPGGAAYDLVRQIRADSVMVGRRIIMVTAEAGVDDVAAAIEAGIDDYLTKPFSPAAIREKLDLLGVLAA